MRLSELNPLWITKDGQQIGMIFKCPCCVNAQKADPDWISCFWVPSPKLSEQLEMFQPLLKSIGVVYKTQVVPCKCKYDDPAIWTRTGNTFEDMTITPSIEASASGNWHGHITNGLIQ